MSYPKSTNIASTPYNINVNIAKHSFLRPYTKTRLAANTSVSGLSILKPAQLNQQYSPSRSPLEQQICTRPARFGILISNFGLTMQLLPKCMLVAYAIAVPAVIVDLPYEQAGRILQGDLNLSCSTSAKLLLITNQQKTWKRKGSDIKSYRQMIPKVFPKIGTQGRYL